MKGFLILINDALLGRKVLLKYEENKPFKKSKEEFSLSNFLKDQSCFEFEKIDKRPYGIDKEFVLDLFMPKDSNF